MLDRGESEALAYDLFGQQITVNATDVELREAIDASLSPFRVAGSATPVAHFHAKHTAAECRIRRGQQINTGRLLIIADRTKLIAASLAAPPWQIHLESFGGSRDDFYYYLFEPLLHVVLKRRGIIPWHGAAVARGDRAILIVGESGSGKSTTALSLLTRGYRFIADDELVLETSGAAIRARSAEAHLHFTGVTAALVGGLPAAESLPLVRRGHGLKHRLDAGFFGPPAAEADLPVGVVLFPRVEPAGETRLQSLPPGECAARLMLHPPKEFPALIVDRPSIERQLDLCTTLATAARCFEIVLGRDLDRVAAVVDAVLT